MKTPHIIKALGYSLKGIKAVWQTEVAFRQEVYVSLVVVPLALWLGSSGVAKALLLSSWLLVLVLELINSAIEAVVDRIGDAHHPLAGKAKDAGSAAVLMAIVLAAVVWGLILG